MSFRGEDYIKGALEYWNSTQKIGAFIRHELGDKVKHIWHRSGDLVQSKIPYSERKKRLHAWAKNHH